MSWFDGSNGLAARGSRACSMNFCTPGDKDESPSSCLHIFLIQILYGARKVGRAVSSLWRCLKAAVVTISFLLLRDSSLLL